MSFDGRFLRVNPGREHLGAYTLTARATDAHGEYVDTLFDLTVGADLSGGDGDDNLLGFDSDDVLEGGDGSDTLDGVAGMDRLLGGAGDDELRFSQDGQWSAYEAWNVGDKDHVIDGQRITVAPRLKSFDYFDGGEGTDRLVMTEHSDALFLRDIYGSQIADSTRISGIEQIEAGAGDDLVDLTSRSDVYGDVTVDGGSGHDILWSNAGNDLLNGGSGDDNLDGGRGADTLNGGDGSDYLYGRLGADVLTGGSGSDLFVYSEIAHSSGRYGKDRITDFVSGEDKVDVSELYLSPGLLRFQVDGDLTTVSSLFYDFELQVNGSISVEDFIFV